MFTDDLVSIAQAIRLVAAALARRSRRGAARE